MEHVQQIQKHEFVDKSDIKRSYITEAKGTISAYDFRVKFYNAYVDLEKIKDDEITIKHDAEIELIMSHRTLRELAVWLNEKVKEVDEIEKKIESEKTTIKGKKDTSGLGYIR